MSGSSHTSAVSTMVLTDVAVKQSGVGAANLLVLAACALGLAVQRRKRSSNAESCGLTHDEAEEVASDEVSESYEDDAAMDECEGFEPVSIVQAIKNTFRAPAADDLAAKMDAVALSDGTSWDSPVLTQHDGGVHAGQARGRIGRRSFRRRRDR